MKNRLMLIITLIIAFAVSTVFIVSEMYYIAAAIIVGFVVVGHQEIWSLLRHGKLLPIDERVTGNMGKAIRNSFLSLIILLALILLSGGSMRGMPEFFLGGILILVEVVYLITYLYYEYMEATLDGRALKILKAFLLLSAISVFIFIFSAYFSNIIYPDAATAIKYRMVHLSIFIISAIGFVVGIVGSSVLFIKGLLARSSHITLG